MQLPFIEHYRGAMFENQIAGQIERRLREKALPISVRLWDEREVQGTPAPKVTVSLRSPAQLSLLTNPSLSKIAESYVEQQIDLDGSARDIANVLADLMADGDSPRASLAEKLGIGKHTKRSDKHAIESHYDVSNEFFFLWLDARRVYSCAYFHGENDTLEQAQEQKLDHICRKLMLKPGERFLDIGCGWGALMLWAAEHYGVQAVGITLSDNQYAHVRELVRARGLEERVQVRLMDYRDLPESQPFDKIASVGMFEHVGVANLPKYFRKIHDLLKPGGLAMNHGITSSTFDHESHPNGGQEFIDRYVFPDGELAHVSKVIELMSRENLEVRDVEGLRPHYAKTLWHWVDRLEANQATARVLVGEKKYRIWRAYMAGFAVAFERGWDCIYQILAGRAQGNGKLAMPLTRDYMYAR
jgi:cyclopropane-fatty-acyl-phospholipid synthase